MAGGPTVSCSSWVHISIPPEGVSVWGVPVAEPHTTERDFGVLRPRRTGKSAQPDAGVPHRCGDTGATLWR